MHSSQIYNSNETWLIHANHTNLIANYLITILGFLCMPAFFMISGYFAVGSFKHASKKNFLKKL